MTYRLKLSDETQTVWLGEFTADTMEDAIKQAKKKYKNMFKRLTLPGWRVLADVVR